MTTTDADAVAERGRGRDLVVHLVRHAQVENPHGIVYGRLPGYGLSKQGIATAGAVAGWLQHRPVVAYMASPLLRAQQTAAAAARRQCLDVQTDERLTEAWNHFEGEPAPHAAALLANPAMWWRLRNPWQPSWGEPYRAIAARMRAAINDLRERYAGGEVVVVSHQAPIYVTRRSFAGRPLMHDPRRRQCAPGSITTIKFGVGPPLIRYRIISVDVQPSTR